MEFRTEELAAQPYVFIKHETTQAEIGERIGASMGQIVPYVGPDNMVAPPFARWISWEGDKGVMEVGLPVRTISAKASSAPKRM